MDEKFKSWDELFETLDNNQRAKIESAVHYLQESLGEQWLPRGDFFSIASLMNYPSPLFLHQILNVATWLKYLKENSPVDANRFIRRTKEKDSWPEAALIAKVAARLVGAGFDCEWEKELSKQRSVKKPDLTITNRNTGEEVVVECSVLGESNASRDAMADIRGKPEGQTIVVNVDEVKRFLGKINKKNRQLPVNAPGVLVIRLAFCARVDKALLRIAERALGNAPNILYVITIEGGFCTRPNPRNHSFRFGRHFLVDKVYPGNWIENLTVIENPFCRLVVSNDTRYRLKQYAWLPGRWPC